MINEPKYLIKSDVKNVLKEWALEYWINKYNHAKDYSDIHWDAEERHEHRDYINAMAWAIKALEQYADTEAQIQLFRAKSLLKQAMEDMKTIYEANKDEGCYGIEFKWRYADEAEKLLKED